MWHSQRKLELHPAHLSLAAGSVVALAARFALGYATGLLNDFPQTMAAVVAAVFLLWTVLQLFCPLWLCSWGYGRGFNHLLAAALAGEPPLLCWGLSLLTDSSLCLFVY